MLYFIPIYNIYYVMIRLMRFLRRWKGKIEDPQEDRNKSLYFPYIISLSLYYHFLLTKLLYVLETLTFPCLSIRARWGQIPSRPLKVDQSMLHAKGFISQIQMVNNMQHQTLFTMTRRIFSHVCTSFWGCVMLSAEVPIQSLTSQSKHWSQLSRTYGGIK